METDHQVLQFTEAEWEAETCACSERSLSSPIPYIGHPLGLDISEVMFFSSASFKAFILMYQESMLVHTHIVNIILSTDAGPTTYQLRDFEKVIQSHKPHFSLVCKRKKIISNTRWLLRSNKATMVKLLCLPET